MKCVWTDYIKFKAELRGFNIEDIEKIVEYSKERYFDTITGRSVAVGRCKNILVMIPYEIESDSIIPVTIHAITRKQINFRIKTGRFVYE
ncbi:MAG: hypothetical protein GF353_11295 [Candidatus Lokiarchaeota archaeon]|nr:hypothetical protein [Candidatus Lokiarchaeota archaeon]